MLTEIVVSLNLFLLVFARLGAMIFPSPVFGRKNVPMRIRAGLVLALTLLLVPVLNVGAVSALSGFDMVEGLVREILLGLIVGFVFQIFFFMIFVAGDMLDTVFGLAMGKVMDPGGGVQVSVLGQFLNVFFFLYFFATGSHRLMIKLFAYSFELIPAGAAAVSMEKAGPFVLALFHSVFVLAIRLTLPFVAAEFVLEAAMGVLMKLIPQIHIFVINLQVKIIAGILLMMLFAVPMGQFIDRYIGTLFEDVQKLLLQL